MRHFGQPAQSPGLAVGAALAAIIMLARIQVQINS